MPQENSRIHALILSTTGEVRSKTLLGVLTDARITYEIVQNGDAEEAVFEWNSKGGKDRPRKTLTKNERSCTFGHRKMYQRALSNKHSCDYFLFLEDDAQLENKDLKSLKSFNWSFEPDLLLLGSCGGWARRKKINLTHQINCHRVFMNSTLGSHAYLANRDGINSLLAGTEKLDVLADEFSRDPKVNLYVIVPFMAFQENFLQTTIPLPKQFTSTRFTRRFLSSLYDDLLDLKYLKRIGARTLRLKELEKFIKPFLKKLPGCNV
jgi:GR25 family glycosyltransferase involved in LPS biosynthesis